LEIIFKASADLLRTAKAEPLLECAVVVRAAGTEDAPEPKPELVHGALEIRDGFASHFAARDPGLDLLENPVEGVHLLGEGDVGHSFLLV
jgi:hypothetical protein